MADEKKQVGDDAEAPFIIPMMNYRGSDGKHMEVIFTDNPRDKQD
jgi:hypothetical protein